jgi:hypothetical protein
MPIQKLYTYVDESGQDTKGRIFVVTVIVSGENHLQLAALCETYERTSGKGYRKWHGTNPQPRLEFMRQVIEDKRFHGTLCFAKFQDRERPDFDAFTIDTLAKAVNCKLNGSRYMVEAWIDGLSKAKRTEYANNLRSKGLRNIHLHRVRDEDSEVLIRLADALAGLLRDAIEDSHPAAVQLAQRGQRDGIIIEL